MQRNTRSVGGMALGLSVLLGVLGLGSLPAGADPASLGDTQTTCSAVQLVLSNPQPGDLLTPGQYVVKGEAFDASAATQPGVDRVQAFWDKSREAGGQFIGQVLAGDPGPVQQLGKSGFALVATIPDTQIANNTHLMYFYARSAQSGQEEVLAMTVQLNTPLAVGALTPTPTPPPLELSPKPCASPTSTPTFLPFPVALAGATPGATESLTLRVSNPQSGDSISHGLYVIQGLAYDVRAQGGTGVDRVQVFLDPRDAGGLFLGDASLGVLGAGGPFGFQVVAALPNRKGGHTISVYAHSAITGHELSVVVPITVT